MWEVIKMLSEDEELKFINKFDHIIGADNEGFVTKYNKDGSKHTDLFRKNVNSDWTIVKKPVDFIVAINSGRKIKSEYLTDYEHIEDLMELIGDFDERFVLKVINGKWFIG